MAELIALYILFFTDLFPDVLLAKLFLIMLGVLGTLFKIRDAHRIKSLEERISILEREVRESTSSADVSEFMKQDGNIVARYYE